MRLRVISALSLVHGREAIDRVSFQFAQPDQRQHAVAIEWLEVSLVPRALPAVAILEPDLTPHERLRRLTRSDGPIGLHPAELLADLALDQQQIWRSPWLRACALLALSRDSPGFTDLLDELNVAEHDDDPDGIVDETLEALRRRSLAEHA